MFRSKVFIEMLTMVLPEILFAVLSNPETKPWTKFQTKPKHNQSQAEPIQAKSNRAEPIRPDPIEVDWIKPPELNRRELKPSQPIPLPSLTRPDPIWTRSDLTGSLSNPISLLYFCFFLFNPLRIYSTLLNII